MRMSPISNQVPCSLIEQVTDSKVAASVTSANMAADLKPAGEATAKPKVRTSLLPIIGGLEHKLSRFSEKPCCVCKDEKAARDECMLFSTAKDPQVACATMVDKYKSCMAGFGFNLP